MFFRSEVFSHLLVTLVYFFFVSVLRFKLDWGVLWLWLGALIGTFFLDIDHLIYWFITHPEEEDSMEARRVIGSVGDVKDVGPAFAKATAGKKIIRLYQLLQKAHESHTRLIFHSAIGQTILFILAIYIITSGGSIFGSALIMAANLHLLRDEWADFGRNKDHLADWLFWQIREPKLREYLKEYLVGVTLVFLVLTGLLIKGI